MIVWLLLAVTGLVSGAPGREQYYLPRETRLLYARTIATSVLSRTPPGARLISARGDLPPLVKRLIHNATSIRLNIVDTFNCSERVYGYYADLDNDCQIFHICLPMQQLFPDQYGPEDLYHFSFICPGYTIFSQDSMTCDWEDSAFPCRQAPQLYHRNNHFFVVPAEDVPRTSPTPSPSPTPESQLNNSSFSVTPSPSPSHSPTPDSELNNSSFSPTPNTSPNTSPTLPRRNPSLTPSPSSSPSPNHSLHRSFRPTPSIVPSPRRGGPRPIPLRRSRTPNLNPSTNPSPKPHPAPRHTPSLTLRAAASLRPSPAASSSPEP